MKKAKLVKFNEENVQYIETIKVKEGVVCDVYKYIHTEDKDLAIITVNAGFSTPRQKVLLGNKTIEGYIEGKGTLTVIDVHNVATDHSYTTDSKTDFVEVGINQIMQWTAGDEDLHFYEICSPPYQDGRYENLD